MIHNNSGELLNCVPTPVRCCGTCKWAKADKVKPVEGAVAEKSGDSDSFTVRAEVVAIQCDVKLDLPDSVT